MQIIALRPFISTRQGVGNVPEGRVLDVDDGYAGNLIEAGLAEKFFAGPVSKKSGNSFFLSEEEPKENGLLSPVAQVSPKKIVKKSKRGVSKTKKDESPS